jgi:hypothetical protein
MTDLEMKSKLQAKLEEIAGILCKLQDKPDNPDVLSGISEFALFTFYRLRQLIIVDRILVNPVY